MNNIEEVIQAISVGLIVAMFLLNTNRFLKAIEICKECLFIQNDRVCIKDQQLSKSLYMRIYLIMWNIFICISDNTNALKYAAKRFQICLEDGESLKECMLSILLGQKYLLQNRYTHAKQLFEKALHTSREIGNRNGEATCYMNLGNVYQSVGEYEKAREYLEKSLVIRKEIGDRNGEAACYINLGNVYISVGEYEKARKYLEESLVIEKEIGNRDGEASCYINLGNVYNSVGEYEKARKYLEESLVIEKEIGNRNGEASCYRSLGTVYLSVGEYEKAREYLEKSLVIKKEIGDRDGEAACYINLGNVYISVGEYEKARKYLEKSLVIKREIGDRNGEATCYINLGNVYQSVGEYEKARKYLEKSLVIEKEIGNRDGEASCYINLGNVYNSVGEYEKAREYLEKSLVIEKEIGDRDGEATCYINLGNVYKSVGEYEKARKYLEKSLVIKKEVGDRDGEAACYLSLGSVYRAVGESGEGLHYVEKSLAISKKIGDRCGIAQCCLYIGDRLCSLGKYSKANEYNKAAFAILKDIGNRPMVTEYYLRQGDVEFAVGNCDKAKEYFENALKMSKEIEDHKTELRSYFSLGLFFYKQSDYDRAEKYIKKVLDLSEEIGDIAAQFCSFTVKAYIRMREGKIQEAISYLLSIIGIWEKIRGLLYDNDQFKISLNERYVFSHRDLSMLLCEIGNSTEALYVSELSRGRALADLMSAQYSPLEIKISANRPTWVGFEGIVPKECNCTCLYVSYQGCSIFLWILKAGRVAHFQEIKGHKILYREGLSQRLDEFFNFRSFGVLPEELCEDHGSLHGFQPESHTCDEGNHKGSRFGNESNANRGPKMNLPICYKLIIAPVTSLLEGSEIIIVPDRALYQIPFAALTDESGKYLSETFRIRIVPSLTTLKLINESPADYHCQTGALIVGNPDVGEVHFKERLTTISRLPWAEKEAKIVGKKLGVEPLLGQQATKEAILQAMNSVALIHIAAHGDAERGEIALAPSFRHPNGTPQEGLYLLTMADISKIQVRAKLVVLSCCHSARGQTKAEGAVGIARAFLGSGARSVLVALWALDDKSTEQLMTHFYDHLVAGQSAGESLHEAMKWMRSEGYDVKHWAPFILIGDDVTFDFGKKGKICSPWDYVLCYLQQTAPSI